MTALRQFTFRGLMTESERALWRTDSLPAYYRSPVCQLLDDGRQYHLWEVSHARLMQQVARGAHPVGQALALRATSLSLIHRRGLFDYLRNHGVHGKVREGLFEAFYGPIDYRAAVLTEHRQFVLAASSGYCSDVLVGSIHDGEGARLIERYARLYRDYFEVFGFFVTAEMNDEPDVARALKPIMLRRRTDVARLRGTILTPPRHGFQGRHRSHHLAAA
jgi:hypothetical protein